MAFLFCWQRGHVSGDVFAGIRWWIKKEATEARLLFRGRTFFIHELIKPLMKSIHNPRAMATERPMKYEPLPTGTCHFQGWFFCSHWCDHCVSFFALPAQTKSVSISRMHVKKTNFSRILNRRTEKKSSETSYLQEPLVNPFSAHDISFFYEQMNYQWFFFPFVVSFSHILCDVYRRIWSWIKEETTKTLPRFFIVIKHQFQSQRLIWCDILRWLRWWRDHRIQLCIKELVPY